MILREAVIRDLPEVTSIYAYNVLNGTGTFALIPPSLDDMVKQYEAIMAMRLPYFVAQEGETVLGFAYASPFRERPGYRYGVEDSIYLMPVARGKGIGKQLLNAVISGSRARGIYTMVAVIGDSSNTASIGVHKACGFTETGRLPNTGYKFERWLDVVFMCRELKATTNPPMGEGWAAT